MQRGDPKPGGHEAEGDTTVKSGLQSTKKGVMSGVFKGRSHTLLRKASKCSHCMLIGSSKIMTASH
jgi:hypothetical protein